MNFKNKLKIFFFAAAFSFLILPFPSRADDLGKRVNFYVDPSYDTAKKTQIGATLQKVTDQTYFYLDDSWWNLLSSEDKQTVSENISLLAQEFENKIYPMLTLNYGSEWKPGIDNDNRITILLYPMMDEAGGYFNSADEYSRVQVPQSNEREMIYLNTKYLGTAKIKGFLAHEFTHLITFNQKERMQGAPEEVWLNEARAEAAPTIVGYDKDFQDSNLQRRVKNFIDNPRDSITDWQNKTSDYGALNLFTQYLLDYYGKEILGDSLKLKKTGIPSINEALQKRGFKEDFSQIFTDWLITVQVNDCGVGPKYCYLNENLKGFRITPYIYFLPTTGESTLSVGQLTKEWAGNWQKIIGGKDNLSLEFSTNAKVNFKIPYIVENLTGGNTVGFLTLGADQKGKISILNKKISSLILIPSVQNKISGFSANEPSYQFFWSASTEKSEEKSTTTSDTAKLLEQIAFLQSEIARIQAQINAILSQNNNSAATCLRLENNLYYGLKNNLEVRCLQQFLKSQGAGIYPEGLITGNFGPSTRAAVIRFQERYADEILKPAGFLRGTGIVALRTRSKINQLISF